MFQSLWADRFYVSHVYETRLREVKRHQDKRVSATGTNVSILRKWVIAATGTHAL